MPVQGVGREEVMRFHKTRRSLMITAALILIASAARGAPPAVTINAATGVGDTGATLKRRSELQQRKYHRDLLIRPGHRLRQLRHRRPELCLGRGRYGRKRRYNRTFAQYGLPLSRCSAELFRDHKRLGRHVQYNNFLCRPAAYRCGPGGGSAADGRMSPGCI